MPVVASPLGVHHVRLPHRVRVDVGDVVKQRPQRPGDVYFGCMTGRCYGQMHSQNNNRLLTALCQQKKEIKTFLDFSFLN